MNEQASVQAPPASVTEYLQTLDAIMDDLPRRLQQSARFTRRHLHLIAVSTVSDMAGAAGVAPSAYMRFCQTLGFSGYSQMQDLFRARFSDFRPDYSERLACLGQGDGIATDLLLAEFCDAGHKSLLSLSDADGIAALNTTAEGLAQARMIHLVGLRRAFPVVSAMAYLFDQMSVPASLHLGVGMLSGVGTITPDDALFAVTFSPFSTETLDLARTTSGQQAKVFGMTDSRSCPLFDVAEQVLIAREVEVAGFRSLNASISLATTLAVAVGSRRKRR